MTINAILILHTNADCLVIIFDAKGVLQGIMKALFCNTLTRCGFTIRFWCAKQTCISNCTCHTCYAYSLNIDRVSNIKAALWLLEG